ncbi:MAG: hypothetical protein II824_05610 [Bacteroidales bacterium]|nr:hypothetical protein [Bacteroidales bacterium]
MSKSVYIKILLLLLLAVTMGCKKEMDTPHSPTPQIQTVHYRASVQTGADTRATLGDGLKYAFEAGDRIYMESESEDGMLYGFLSLSSEGGIGQNTALFEGDLNYVGEEPFQNNNPTVSLVLVSRKDELHTITDGKVGTIENGSYRSNQWAPSLEEAVSCFSHFTGTGSFNDMRFTLRQQSSFLKCFVRMKAEQATEGREMSVKLLNLNGDVLLREASVTVSTVGSVPFVFAFPGDAVTLENAKLRLEWVEPGIGAQTKDFDVSGKKLAANNYYSISRTTLDFDGFRIRAISNNTKITFNYDYANDGIEYSLDFGESWTHYKEPFYLNADDVACIRGNRKNYKNGGADQYDGPKDKPIFRASLKCYISGNIMSLVGDATELSESAFQGAFSRGGGTPNADIDIDPESPLILPATTLATKCYMNMFRNCTSLTRAPQFRVEGTASGCCYNMFRQCSNLVDVSGIELPAQTLSDDCYRELFRQCSKLTTAPVLPAAKLVKSCYQQMFSACSALTSVTCLATDITTAPDCTNNWMGDVPNNQTVPRTFYVASEEMKSIWSRGISGILSNWKVEVYSE